MADDTNAERLYSDWDIYISYIYFQIIYIYNMYKLIVISNLILFNFIISFKVKHFSILLWCTNVDHHISKKSYILVTEEKNSQSMKNTIE